MQQGRLTVVAIAATGLGAVWASAVVLHGSAAAFAAALAVLCAIVTLVDLQRFIIPDTANLAIFVLGVAQMWASAANGALLADAGGLAARCLAAGGVLWLTRLGYRLASGRDGLGLGDVKLAAAGGSCLSWESLPLALQIGVLIALVAVGLAAVMARRMPERHAALPFGACLAPAIWVAFVLERV